MMQMYDYFYEEQSEQFAFYRIPKVLMTEECFAGLSTDAKILYGLFLDRVSLSRKNRWIDASGRIYIYYTLESIEENIGCAVQKAIKLLKELERYRLIERKKQGQGKPSAIYVKNFLPLRQSQGETYENHSSGLVKITGQDLRKSQGNNTEFNKTEENETDLIVSADGMRSDEREEYRAYFEETLEVPQMKAQHPFDEGMIDEILELILDTVCSRRETMLIAGEQRPLGVVKSRLMKLDSGHLAYVLDALKHNTADIRNIKQYILATLYNAPLTINNYYTTLVSHDMAAGKI